jgi:chemotaxis methyl-accepting protein methylase/GAF domain-containing protein
LKSFFTGLRSPAELAFVVIQHRGCDAPSHLVQLLSSWSALPACQIVDGDRPRSGHVHIAPTEYVRLEEGIFRTCRIEGGRPRRIDVIDVFFESLANDLGSAAIAVVLSGTGNDGAAGAICVKRSGGLVFVQDPDTALHASMPRAVISHGITDYILPAAEIAEKVVLSSNLSCFRSAGATRDVTEALDDIVLLVRKHAGFDLRGYKSTPLLWRLQQRMDARHLGTLRSYVALLKEEPEELDALILAIAIHVTEFFRDAPAWEILRELVVDSLCAELEPGRSLRIWTPACSTGEEAYSVAMLLSERLQAVGKPLDFRVLATDASAAIVTRASLGIYPARALRGMSPQRVLDFMDELEGIFRVKHTLREKLVFASQNVLVDPPFTNLDMITCRNMLIYLDLETAQRVVQVFHGALRVGGYLFLGSAESVLPGQNGFEAVSQRWRIYRKREETAPPNAMLDMQQWSEVARISSEELDASREELQALNEELNASNDQLNLVNQHLNQVNARLNGKVTELEMQRSVLSSGEVAAVFLDQALQVQWFTAAITELFPLRPGDIGRCILDLSQRFDAPRFVASVREVMRSGEPHETEVRTSKGRIFTCRIRLYMSDNKPAGGVAITFNDVTARSLAESALRRTEASVKAQKDAFQAELNGEPLNIALEFLARSAAEQMDEGAQCAIYLPDAAGIELRQIAGTSRDYRGCSEMLTVGPDSMACGLAMYTGRPEMTADISLDDRWSRSAQPPADSGFRGCWSFPIETKASELIGVLAIFHRQPRQATPWDLEVMTLFTRAAALIISRHQQGAKHSG